MRSIPFRASTFVRLTLGSFIQWALRFGFRTSATYEPGFVEIPCVYASNHRSFVDPPLVSVFVRQPVSFFARESLWKVLPIAFLLNIFRAVPVNRGAPSMNSMKKAVTMLREGNSLLVFPEGTRTRTGRLGKLRDGPSLFARRAGVPVVPVYVHRSEAAWPRGWPIPCLSGPRIAIVYGAPIWPPNDVSGREADAWVTRKLSAWMHRQEAHCYR